MSAEAITEAELADYLEIVNGQRRDVAEDIAKRAVIHARRGREPRPGAYEDPEGNLYIRVQGLSAWLRVMDDGTTEVRPGDWLERPLRKLVPEGSPLADSERDLIRRDLGQLLELLGLGDFARPQSSHEVFMMCLEAVAKLKAASDEGTCPGGC